ncbi:carboxylesterase family protein [Sphingobacterium yanglingense]|uniref:Phospholipase/carboxylesterase n=1 Tax=Sphingobacterium yanglingense TaxID=1437280 RepID=A0A4R6WIV8_9SPHI|nr:dienelactone hydrolase family protein [Sphingobacterium yanglingense]TDQ78301.1 phospholipase/carboxylesterase [Sphingobacterium yanglingense]
MEIKSFFRIFSSKSCSSIRVLSIIAFCFYSALSIAQEKAKVNYKHLTYLPEKYNTDTSSYPLVIYLHGGSQKGNDLEKLKIYGLPYLADQGKEFDFIIIAPQCPDGKYWSTENWFDPLYNEVISNYRVDKSRVYVTGISMGGYGTYIAALDHSDKIAAIVPLCGGVNDSDTSRICVLKDIPILTYHGTADKDISIQETERIVNGLKKCEGNIIFHRLEGEGHGIQYLYETNPDIYQWLLKQRKPNLSRILEIKKK